MYQHGCGGTGGRGGTGGTGGTAGTIIRMGAEEHQADRKGVTSGLRLKSLKSRVEEKSLLLF